MKGETEYYCPIAERWYWSETDEIEVKETGRETMKMRLTAFDLCPYCGEIHVRDIVAPRRSEGSQGR